MENSEQSCTFLTEEVVRGWFDGYLRPTDTIEFRAHLDECSGCRKRLVKMLRDYRVTNCVEKKFISSWLKGWVTLIDGDKFRKHITICYECRKELIEMLESWPRDDYLD